MIYFSNKQSLVDKLHPKISVVFGVHFIQLWKTLAVNGKFEQAVTNQCKLWLINAVSVMFEQAVANHS